MEGKTTREWLEEMKEPFRTQALVNYEKCPHRKRFENEVVPEAMGALLGAFDFRHSPEGHQYWMNVADSLRITTPWNALPGSLKE